METLGAFSLTFVSALCYYYTMQKFSTVEDYIEIIAGYRDPATGNLNNNWFLGFQPIISLARYDTDVLDSMSSSTTGKLALTERQGELACKLILKYQRQLAAKHVDVSPVENPVWRVPLRKMDYSRRLYLQDEKMYFRFPYDQKLIEQIRDNKSKGQGVCEFDYDNKVWRLGLTEYNLNWAYSWAKQNGFSVEPEIEALFQKLLEVEKQDYAIELVCTDHLDIVNCPASLREYINEHLGGFGLDNLMTLVNAAASLGITLHEDLEQALIQEYGARFVSIAKHRELRISPESPDAGLAFDAMLDYADRVGAFPVVVYEPDLSEKMLNRIRSKYSTESVLVLGNSRLDSVPSGVKFIHTAKPIRSLENIPIVISGAGMVFGGDKQSMLQCARKIVYMAAEVYNNAPNKATKVVKIAG